MKTDAAWMARALQLARRGLYTTQPNPRVGCVLVRGEQVIAEGWHERAGEAHAEVMALELAGESARNATAYVSLEPCSHHGRTPPCNQALIGAGVKRVVMAMRDPNPQVSGQGEQELRDAGIEVEVGVLEAEAQSLNRGFIKRMQQGRPWVTVKLAMSLDGNTAAADGSSQWITGTEARADGHRLRARAGAVLTGIGTVLADDPQLNVRLDEAADWPSPRRFVLDSHLRMPATAAMLSNAGQTTVFTHNDDAGKARLLQEAGAKIVSLAADNDRVSLPEVLDWLGAHEINEVLVEAGADLAGAFVQAGLFDELLLYLAPTLLGADGRGLLALPALRSINQQMRLRITDVRAVGSDWRITASPAS